MVADLGTLFFAVDILLIIASSLGSSPGFALHFYAGAVCRHVLGALAAELFLLDRSGGEHGPASFRDRMALIADSDGESDFHPDHAAALLLLAVSVRGKGRSR